VHGNEVVAQSNHTSLLKASHHGKNLLPLSGWAALTGIAVIIIGGITGAILATTITRTKITKENVRITGVHRDFLAQLPE